MRTIPGQPDRLDRESELMQEQFKQLRKSPYLPSVGCYNLTISHERKFLWYRVAKVGTRTILSHLKESGVCLDVEHASWIHYPVNSVGDYVKFAFVRNPWDRLASCWRDKIINNNSLQIDGIERAELSNFDKFVNYVSGLNIDECDRHLRSQSALIDLNMVDYLGRMETFEDDAAFIFRKLGLPERQIDRKNVTATRKNYREYYSDQLAEQVAQVYRKDIQIFGYQF
jgi:hypothetical protein